MMTNQKESRLLTEIDRVANSLLSIVCSLKDPVLKVDQILSLKIDGTTLKELIEDNTKSVKAIIEWGIEPCPHWADVTEKVIKRDCSLCWQALKRGQK